MDETMKNEVIDVDYEIEEGIEVTEMEPEEPSGGFGKLILGVLAIGGAIAGYRHLTKEKRRAKQIKKLEKEGYVVYKEEDLCNDCIEELSSEAIEAEEE